MKLIIRLLVTTLAGVTVNCHTTPSSPSTSQTGCPTVTLTSSICAACAHPDCVQVEPVTASCGCPSAVPTVFVDFPCGSGCLGIGCATNYIFFDANCTSPTSSSPSLTLPAAFANATGSLSWMGTNITASGTTATGRLTSLKSATGSALSTSPSIAAAGRMRPFWAVWL